MLLLNMKILASTIAIILQNISKDVFLQTSFLMSPNLCHSKCPKFILFQINDAKFIVKHLKLKKTYSKWTNALYIIDNMSCFLVIALKRQ
jgi:hypothetical protein